MVGFCGRRMLSEIANYALNFVVFLSIMLTNLALPSRVIAQGEDAIFVDGFESGDLSGWSSAVVDGGDLSVSGAAALEGSYGLAALVDDTTKIYVQDDSPVDETHYRMRFMFDPNSISTPTYNAVDLFYTKDLNVTYTTYYIQMRNSAGSYQVQFYARIDDEVYVGSGWITIVGALLREADAGHPAGADLYSTTRMRRKG
jgi:hypothetical protein